MDYIWSLLMGYVIGAINPSYIFAKIKGFDIRKRGSGNAGASNAIITMGKTVGIISAIFDIIKAFAAVKIAGILFPETHLSRVIAGAACIIGHIFPFYMNFKGGKGLACLGGVVLAFDWKVFIIFAAIETILAFSFDYICIVPITGAIAYPFIFGFTQDWTGALVMLIPCLVILTKHRDNIRRIKDNTEVHLSFLWKGKKELERVIKNCDDAESETSKQLKEFNKKEVYKDKYKDGPEDEESKEENKENKVENQKDS